MSVTINIINVHASSSPITAVNGNHLSNPCSFHEHLKKVKLKDSWYIKLKNAIKHIPVKNHLYGQ